MTSPRIDPNDPPEDDFDDAGIGDNVVSLSGEPVDNNATRTERRIRAYNLRLKGKFYRDIAADLGCSVGTAHKLIQEEIDNRVVPATETVRMFELDRLDSYLDRVERAMDLPDADVAKLTASALKIGERRARLMGLDAPEKLDATVQSVDAEDLELMQLIAEQKVKNRVEEQRIRDEVEK